MAFGFFLARRENGKGREGPIQAYIYLPNLHPHSRDDSVENGHKLKDNVRNLTRTSPYPPPSTTIFFVKNTREGEWVRG